ncbi:hypothetical protein [Oceanobacter kriegii]|uniref:hypothetical protein n=1 Tax=Oceanobacter kriegii TaxID=64972 RepID=UPI0004089A3F|nr:hypothetical protein [Oceanobacter kriegii]
MSANVFKFIFLAFILLPSFSYSEETGACPYGYQNEYTLFSSSGYMDEFKCNSKVTSNGGVVIDTCSTGTWTGYKAVLVAEADCFDISQDSSGETGCSSLDAASSGFCTDDLKECETYNGLHFYLETSKNCGDYCADSAGSIGYASGSSVHVCTEEDSDYDRGQSTGDESEGPCAACPDSTDELEYVGRDDGGNSCYTQYLTSEDGTGYSISYMCYDENGDQVTQDGDISFDCETSPQYCDTDSGSGSGTNNETSDPSDDSDDADSNSGDPDPDPEEDSGTGGGDDDSGTDVEVSDEQPEYESNTEKVEAVQAEYLEALENLTNQFDDYFDFGNSSGSPFGTDKHTIKGAVVDFGLGRFSGLFGLLPSIIMLFASAQSAYIILGGSKS